MSILIRIIRRICREFHWVFYNFKLKSFGRGSVINTPLAIEGNNIQIGKNTTIQYKSWLAANPLTGNNQAELIIGNGCAIGHFNEIYATKSIVIDDYVLTADRVYISDNLHSYEDYTKPIINQPIKQVGTVHIGEGSWLGVGVCVIGANIGKHCVIGANAVVLTDVPDYSVAAGAPAKVIKTYNKETRCWEKVKKG